jgi:isopenicillin N synthase-like dioxygenase
VFDLVEPLREHTLTDLREATLHDGWFRLRHPLFSEARCSAILSRARSFFSRPLEEKMALSIERSAHFRGYSVMESSRDWRDQIHFGKEEAPMPGPPACEQLRGPNLWPDDKEWRAHILCLMQDLELAGREVLCALATSIGTNASAFLPAGEASYVLLKLMHYRGGEAESMRSGVAPHVEFSWITLGIQDETGGLEVRLPGGPWVAVEPEPGTLTVNIGEILEFATGGLFRATPHRVLTGLRSRVSLPFFLNPALDRMIRPLPASAAVRRTPDDGEHVHRVFAVRRTEAFIFGEEEWRRKGLGRYCELCVPEQSHQVTHVGMGTENRRTSISE